jgi:hypothetical protein
MNIGTATLDALVGELEAAAASLRRGQLDAEQAAVVVERCADLATRVGAELDSVERAARAEAHAEPRPGQEELL